MSEVVVPVQNQIQASPSFYKASAPIVWDGVNDKTISDLEINNPGDTALSFPTAPI